MSYRIGPVYVWITFPDYDIRISLTPPEELEKPKYFDISKGEAAALGALLTFMSKEKDHDS